MQPALSAYQRKLYHDVHGPNEPLPGTRVKSTSVDPFKEKTSALPSLPNTLLEKQQLLTENRITESHVISSVLSGSPGKPPHHHRASGIRHKSSPTSVIRKRSSELLLNSDPDAVMTRYFPPLEFVNDPLEIVNRLKREPELGFLYLTPVEERQSVKYNPYNLRCV